MIRLLFGIAVAATFVGCDTLKNVAKQDITIHSFPTGATVLVDGEKFGKTPLAVELPRAKQHEIRLEKTGYKPIDTTLAPETNEGGKAFVQFGLLKDAGYYSDLEPNPVEFQLIPEIIPNSRSHNAYDEMASLIMEVDRQRELGEIGALEHKYKVAKIVEFYTN